MILCLYLVVSGGASQAAGNTYLSGTVRSFGAAHPDFDVVNGDVGLSIVASTPTPNGKPIYDPQAPPATISSGASFAQWWEDVPAVNATSHSTLPFSDVAGQPAHVEFPGVPRMVPKVGRAGT